MGFGAIIASGEKNKVLRDDLLDCLTEVRVEQFLDEPTRFAIRFQEDIRDGNLFIMKSPELQCEQMITIAVQVGDAMRCLVRGPITDIKCSVKLGGPVAREARPLQHSQAQLASAPLAAVRGQLCYCRRFRRAAIHL
jgi:hypothetical protein